MNAPTHLIANIDIAGSFAVFVLSVYAFMLMRRIVRRRKGHGLYMYLYIQTLTLVIFACSRSLGHILKHVLVNTGRSELWATIAPISGSINSLTFVGFGLAALMYSNIKGMAEQMESIERRRRELSESEAKLKELLSTKEALLSEVHHRVKNNMAIMSALHGLQIAHIKDPEGRRAIEESRDRIMAMATVHEMLYMRPDITQVDVGDYIRGLSQKLFSSLGARGNVSLTVETAGVRLGMDAMVPLGLIVNELLTNSVRHAFRHRNGLGKIGASLVPLGPDSYRLVITDDGSGIGSDFDIESAQTLGMKLVTSLVEQLDGSIDIDSHAGTRITIEFRSPRPPQPQG